MSQRFGYEAGSVVLEKALAERFDAVDREQQAREFERAADPDDPRMGTRRMAALKMGAKAERASAKAGDYGHKLSDWQQHGNTALSDAERKAHVVAGEAHLKAAEAHEKSGYNSASSYGSYHRGEAEKHAAAAGSEWDESKDPRDENGKFT